MLEIKLNSPSIIKIRNIYQTNVLINLMIAIKMEGKIASLLIRIVVLSLLIALEMNALKSQMLVLGIRLAQIMIA